MRSTRRTVDDVCALYTFRPQKRQKIERENEEGLSKIRKVLLLIAF